MSNRWMDYFANKGNHHLISSPRFKSKGGYCEQLCGPPLSQTHGLHLTSSSPLLVFHNYDEL